MKYKKYHIAERYLLQCDKNFMYNICDFRTKSITFIIGTSITLVIKGVYSDTRISYG